MTILFNPRTVITVVSLLLTTLPAVANDGPFRLVERSRVEGLFGEPMHRFVFENAGDKTVVAYRFTCVVSNSEGLTGTTSMGEDAFRTVTLFPSAVDTVEPGDVVRHGGPILPGRRIQAEIGERPPENGPFGTQVCGIGAVVFGDLTTWGDEEEVESIFTYRRGLVAESLAVLQMLDAEPLSGFSNASSAEVVDQLQRALPTDRRGLYQRDVQRAANALELGHKSASVVLDELRARVEWELEGMAQQLRASDLRQLGIEEKVP